jgi:hypothetical protein
MVIYRKNHRKFPKLSKVFDICNSNMSEKLSEKFDIVGNVLYRRKMVTLIHRKKLEMFDVVGFCLY